MKTLTKIKILNRLKIFNQARDLYYHWCLPWPQILNFYRPLIKAGDLCFDVGANIGLKTDAFLALGAKVIAIEPQPDCCRYLQKKYKGNPDVVVIPQALDEQKGSKPLYLCEANAISTMSQEWIASTQQSGRYKDYQWDKLMSIPTTTLDYLIGQYGRPCFCKIDVEGYELNVLKGLTQPLPGISLEITPESFAMIKECLLYLNGLGRPQFNHSANSLDPILSAWIPFNEFMQYLNSKDKRNISGDIYIKFDV